MSLGDDPIDSDGIAAVAAIRIVIASLCVYLFIGMIFAFVFGGIELLEPGSFEVQPQLAHVSVFKHESIADFGLFFYYSFVTLTTLGYGDITPTTVIAGSVASLEAVIGQIYLVILVARLVGMHISRRGDIQPPSR